MRVCAIPLFLISRNIAFALPLFDCMIKKILNTQSILEVPA